MESVKFKQDEEVKLEIPPIGDEAGSSREEENGDGIVASDDAPDDDVPFISFTPRTPSPSSDSDDDVDPEGDEDESDGYEGDYEDDDSAEFNANVFMAKSLRENGALPDDFELRDDLTYDEVFTAVRERAVGKAAEEGRKQALDEIRGKYSDEDLLFVRAHRQGADPTTFNTVERMRVYGNVDLDEASEEDKKKLVVSMHVLSGMDEEDARILTDAKKAQLDELALQAKNAHADGFNQWQKNVNDREAQAEQLRQQQQSNTIAKVNHVLTHRKAGGVDFTVEQATDLRRDLFEAHETLVHNGQTLPVTAVNKFLYEFQNDVELQLELYMLHKNKDLFLKKTRQQGRSEVEQEMRKAAEKVKRHPSKRKSKRSGSSGMDRVSFS